MVRRRELTPRVMAAARPRPVHSSCPPRLIRNAAKFLENNTRARFFRANGDRARALPSITRGYPTPARWRRQAGAAAVPPWSPERFELHRGRERTGVLADRARRFWQRARQHVAAALMLPIFAIAASSAHADLKLCNSTSSSRRRRRRLPGRNRLGHRGLVEHRLADVRDVAQGSRPQPLYLRSRPRL